MRAKFRRYALVGLGVAVVLCWTGTAGAVRPTKAETCEATKNTAAGKLAKCLEDAQAKAVKMNVPPVFTKCTVTFQTAFAGAEGKAGPGVCPTEGDAAAIEAQVNSAFIAISAALTGIRFVDNGDGTITDTETGLMWEQKAAGSALPHGVDAFSEWPNAMSEFISQVNGYGPVPGGIPQTGLAGHSDWRLPTSAELQTLLVPPCPQDGITPCIDPIFGPTGASVYWSSSTVSVDPLYAWGGHFDGGVTNANRKDSSGTHPNRARAVRGGL